MHMVLVYVPTHNEDKVEAVHRVFSELPQSDKLEVIRVDLGVTTKPPLRQPVGWSEICKGAELRAQASSLKFGNGYHIGIQSGLISLSAGKKTVWMDQACVFVLSYLAGALTTSFSATATVPVPDEFANRVKNGMNELSAIIALYGKREDKDAVAFFSRHFARRKDFIADALRSTLGAISFSEEMDHRPKGPNLTVIK